VALTWAEALAWRMRRQLLTGGVASAAEVVRRLGALVAGSAPLAVEVRGSSRESLARALAAGAVVKTWAFRGAVHLMTVGDAAAYLKLRAAGRQWERTSWQRFYDLRPADWPELRARVRAALAGGPRSGSDLWKTATAEPPFRHLRQVSTNTLFKAFAWQGDLSLTADNRFQLVDLPTLQLDEAGRHAVEIYYRSYGPAAPDHVHYWLGSGLSAGRKRIDSWIAALGDRLVPVLPGGYCVLRDDLSALETSRPSDVVRLLPGHDQWVLGPGTKDTHIVPPEHRTGVTRGANLVLSGGVVSGTWRATKGGIVVDSPSMPASCKASLDHETARVAALIKPG
jgi:hypothetical protein